MVRLNVRDDGVLFTVSIYSLNNSRRRLACTRLTGTSVDFLSFIFRMKVELNHGTTSLMCCVFTRNERCGRQKDSESSVAFSSSIVRLFVVPSTSRGRKE